MKHHAILYGELLPTLGSRILPSLLRRLVTVSQGNDEVLIEYVTKAIARVADSTVGASSIALLEHPSPFVKRAALKVLTLCPHGPALDSVWTLHREILTAPGQFVRPHERSMEVSAESFSALKECAKLNPQRLALMISTADPKCDPVHVLASVLSTLQDQNLWQQCKGVLFSKVRPEDDQVLAINIFHYRDSQYIEWLSKQIDRSDYLVGPWSLRALARLDPDRAIAELPRLPLQMLWLTKRWCFSELQRRRPEPAKRYILSLLQNQTPAIQLASVFKGQESEVDRETLGVLFELLERELDQELRGTCADISPRIYAVASLLADMRYPHQFDAFDLKKISPLATKVTEWLLRRGPIPDEFARPDQQYALSILERFGGSGFGEVINGYLESENPIARRDALYQAARQPNAKTIEILKAITLRPELDQGFPIDQSLATYALAVAGLNREVIDAVMQWGLNICQIDLSQQLPGAPLSDHDVAVALDGVRNGNVSPAVILAFGIAGRTDQIDLIRGVLRSSNPSSDIGHAALIAISALRDRNGDTISLITRHLAVAKHSITAIKALYQIGTTEALEALLSHLESSYSDDLAFSLLRENQFANRVVPLLRHRLKHLSDPEKSELLARLILTTQDRKLLVSVLDEEPTKKLLYDKALLPEQHITITGLKVASIRMLAKFDSDAAFDLAKEALLSQATRNREFYPSLLIEIDPNAAVLPLLLLIQGERSASLRRAIGRALATMSQLISSNPLATILSGWFKDLDPLRRKATAEVLGYICQSGDARINDITQLLDDDSHEVVQAASQSLDRIKSVKATWELATLLHRESDLRRKWVLLDALIKIGDPGDEHLEPPEWFRQTRVSLPPFWRSYIDKQVYQRRKELLTAQEDF